MVRKVSHISVQKFDIAPPVWGAYSDKMFTIIFYIIGEFAKLYLVIFSNLFDKFVKLI